MIDTIKQFLQENPALLSLYGLGSVGFIAVYFKKFFINFFKNIYKLITISIEIPVNDGRFLDVLNYLYSLNKNLVKNIALDNYSTTPSYVVDGIENQFFYGVGFSFSFYKKRLLLINISEVAEGTVSDTRKLLLSLTYFGFSKKILIDLINESKKYRKELYEKSNNTSNTIVAFQVSSMGETATNNIKYIQKKYEENFLIEKNKLNQIYNAIDNFIINKKEYIKKGIPYHKGFLFYGPPGTGKSSLIKLIATKYKSTVFITDISNIISFDSLSSMGSLDSDEITIFVIEDIDLFKGTNRTDKRRNSDDKIDPVEKLQKLLNSLDGLTTPENFIILATTNKLEELDEALKRPGRFDHLIEIGYIVPETFNQACKLYYNKETSFTNIKSEITPSQLQLDYLSGLTFEDFVSKYVIN